MYMSTYTLMLTYLTLMIDPCLLLDIVKHVSKALLSTLSSMLARLDRYNGVTTTKS